MPSSRFAEVKIGSIYLTSNGLITGNRAKCRVENGEQFASSIAAKSSAAADGTVWTQTIALGVKGKEFAILCDFLPESVMNSLKTILNAALASGSTVAVEVTDFVSFTVQAMPVFENGKLFSCSSRSGGILQNVRLKFIAVS